METFNIHKSINFKTASFPVTKTDLRLIKGYYECYPIELYACSFPAYKSTFKKGKIHSKYPTVLYLKKPIPYKFLHVIQG